MRQYFIRYGSSSCSVHLANDEQAIMFGKQRAKDYASKGNPCAYAVYLGYWELISSGVMEI